MVLHDATLRRWVNSGRPYPGAARLGGGRGERTGASRDAGDDVGASGDALSGVAVLFIYNYITTTTTTTTTNGLERCAGITPPQGAGYM